MPTNAIGLVVFVAALAPGLAYVAVREARSPRRVRSAFRETAAVVVVSAISFSVAGSLFALASAVAGQWTPNAGAFIRQQDRYFQLHYANVLGWGTGLLLLSCALAALAAYLLPDMPGAIQSRSAWVIAFEDDRAKGRAVHVGCELADGSYLSGALKRFSTEPEEIADRDLTLEGPVTYLAPGEEDVVDLGVNMVVVSARQVKFLTISFPPSTQEGRTVEEGEGSVRTPGRGRAS